MKRKLSNVFVVSLDGEKVGQIPATKIAARQWVKQNVLSTHMGYWRECLDGYEYATTIGRYYYFQKPDAPLDK